MFAGNKVAVIFRYEKDAVVSVPMEKKTTQNKIYGYNVSIFFETLLH